MRQWMVDAFAREPFKGNPACVLEPFDAWPDAGWMQALAAENNQSETAFLLKTAQPGRFGLRWFTPTMEVPLCGHATLAAGHVLFSELDVGGESLTFDTQAGSLVVRQTESGYAMDFPQDQPTPAVSPGLAEALGAEPVELYAGRFLLAVLSSEAEVRGLKPDIGALRTLGSAAGLPGDVVVAAAADPGSAFDVVDRVFAPASGIQEDPATGSAHCLLAPVFAAALGRDSLRFLQAFPGRGAEIEAEVSGDRVILRGEAVTVVVGRLRLRA